jgi:putative aldouronate transport system substrate-binding protein
MKPGKAVSLLCCVALVGTILAACNGKSGNKETGATGTGGATSFAKRIQFSATSVDVKENVNYMQDEIYKTLDKKFNFEYKLIPLSWDNWHERDRIWINSGDMPDMMFWDFNFLDYKNYIKQGLIKPLPKDYEKKYPNLAKSIAKSGVADFLKKQDPEGRLYMVPNVIYNTPVTQTTDLILDPKVVYYRKDWAKKVGVEVGDTLSVEQLANLAKQFVEKDPGGNGANRTVGISSTSSQLFSAFVQTYNQNYNKFYKKDGKYVFGGFDDSTFEGVKSFYAYFKQGIIDKDFYAFKGKEFRDKFDAGIAGMFIDGASAANINERIQSFAKANPGIDANAAVGVATVVDKQGKYQGETNLMNFWAGELFNPNLDDEKFDRILRILDYIATPEGQRLVFAGVEGKDYVMKGDKIEITREKDASGNFKYIADLYPSYYFFYTKVILPDDWSAKDPSLPASARDAAVKMFRIKEKITNLVPPDFDLIFLSAPNKDKFNVSVDDAIVKATFSDKDLETAWNEWKKSVEPKVNAVKDEINSALVKISEK